MRIGPNTVGEMRRQLEEDSALQGDVEDAYVLASDREEDIKAYRDFEVDDNGYAISHSTIADWKMACLGCRYCGTQPTQTMTEVSALASR